MTPMPRELARDLKTGDVGVVMAQMRLASANGIVTVYVLRPPAGGREWRAYDVELLGVEEMAAEQ